MKSNTLFYQTKIKIAGISLCALLSIFAAIITQQTALPIMMLALFMGMSLSFTAQKDSIKPGIDFTSKTLLRLGVVFIGARIAFEDFGVLGITGIVLVIAATAFVISLSLLVAKILKLDKEQGILIGGATAICGASAALAISSVMPNSKTLEQNTLLAVLGVTTMGTIAMILSPFVVSMLGYNDHQAGVLVGGTIHDVAQVVGAGYSISPEAGDTAILIKLMRVFLLIPVLFAFAYWFKSQNQSISTPKTPFPMFLVGFFALMLLNSFDILPQSFLDILKHTSKWLLIMAIAAVGMKTSIKTLCALGWKPFLLVFLNTLAITALYLTIIMQGIL